MRRVIAAALLVVALVMSPSPALAHGDVRLVDQSLVLAPGASARFDGALHYHRLVGRIAADGPLVVRFVQADNDAAVLEQGPANSFVFNELIRCCDDRAWSPHVLLIENVGAQPVNVYANVGLVHDDLAVMVYGAETGTTESLVVFGTIWIALLWRAVRRPRAAASIRRAFVAFVVLGLIVVLMAWYGDVRYGVAGVPAFVAALSEVPVLPPNPLVSSAMLLSAASLGGWGLAGLWWARLGPAAGRIAWLALGLSLAGAVALVTVLMISAYGTTAVPVASAAVAAIPVLVVMGVAFRRQAVDQKQVPRSDSGIQTL